MARSKITSSKFVWVHSWQIRIQSVHKYERTDHSFVADWNDTDQKGTEAPVAFALGTETQVKAQDPTRFRLMSHRGEMEVAQS